MKQQISLREANQHLSRYIQAVERGDEIIITKRGKPVAKLVHVVEEHPLTPEQRAAWERIRSIKIKTSGVMFTWCYVHSRCNLYGDRLRVYPLMCWSNSSFNTVILCP
jgi:prevent-host-death family protein